MALESPPAALTAARVPWPTGPATGMMMSAPWDRNCSVSCWPLAVLEKSPTKEPPEGLAGSQPRTWTEAPLSALYFSTPLAKPSMTIWTVGMAWPP